MNPDALPKSGQLGEVVVTAQKQPLQMFTKDDIKSLGFNNYQGLLNAVSNRNNWNNNFVKALNNRFGTDYANWKQEDIENALGVKGKYRSFGEETSEICLAAWQVGWGHIMEIQRRKICKPELVQTVQFTLASM